MKNRLAGCRGSTLTELMVAAGLAGLISLGASAFATTLYQTGSGIEAEFLPASSAHLAVETIIQRVLRAAPMDIGGGRKAHFQIVDSGRGVRFQSAGSGDIATVKVEGDRLVYRTEGDEQTLLHGAKRVLFYSVPFERLAIEIELAEGKGTVFSSVSPRNRNTPRSWIN